MQALPDRVTVLVDEAAALRRRRRCQDPRGAGSARPTQAAIDFANAKLRLTRDELGRHRRSNAQALPVRAAWHRFACSRMFLDVSSEQPIA